jgi:hypothetical protein
MIYYKVAFKTTDALNTYFHRIRYDMTDKLNFSTISSSHHQCLGASEVTLKHFSYIFKSLKKPKPITN